METETTAEVGTTIPTQRVQERLLADLFGQSGTVLLGSSLVGVLNLAYYWRELPVTWLACWAMLVLPANTLRYLLWSSYRSDPWSKPTDAWHQQLRVTAVLLGLGWGVLAMGTLLVDPPSSPLVALVTAAGLVGASVAASSASKSMFRVFAVATLAPVMVGALLSDASANRPVGIMALIYLLMLANASSRIHETLRSSIEAHLRNETLVHSLREQSRVDALTGLLNRRALSQDLSPVWETAERRHRKIGLILCDVDYFKQYNDSLGHLAGDQCLQEVAKALASTTRSSDRIVARFGGEEFAVLLPESNEATLQQVSERLRHAVLALQIPHPSPMAGPYVTISVGASQLLPVGSVNLQALLRGADEALYRAKAEGRNRTELVVA